MFRSVIVSVGEYLRLKDNWLVVEAEGQVLRQIPIEDVYCLLIDNPRLTMTVPVITALTVCGAHIILCDSKHMPVSVIYSLNNHYQPLNVIKRQLHLGSEAKDALWQAIIKCKIANQARCLSFRHLHSHVVRKLEALADEVELGDSGNREGIAARLFFRALYGSEFIRSDDSGVNSALNYGYAIMRSAVAKTLVAYGYNCVLGIHHINEANPFNLADDLMEPLRPFVDLWVDIHLEELVDCSLSKQVRLQLANLPNHSVECCGKKMKVRNAIDKYVHSYTTALKKADLSRVHFPVLRRDSGAYRE